MTSTVVVPAANRSVVAAAGRVGAEDGGFADAADVTVTVDVTGAAEGSAALVHPADRIVAKVPVSRVVHRTVVVLPGGVSRIDDA